MAKYTTPSAAVANESHISQPGLRFTDHLVGSAEPENLHPLLKFD